MRTNAGIATLLFVAATLGVSDAARAQNRHLDELALEIQHRAGDVCWELHHHHRGQRDYRLVYRECYEMFTIARVIHDLAHHGGSERRIARYTEDLDDQFHHLEEHFHEWGMPDWHRHPDDRDHGGLHGRFSFGRYGRLARQMNGLGEALHHLMDDVGYESRHESPYAPPLPEDGLILPRP